MRLPRRDRFRRDRRQISICLFPPNSEPSRGPQRASRSIRDRAEVASIRIWLARAATTRRAPCHRPLLSPLAAASRRSDILTRREGFVGAIAFWPQRTREPIATRARPRFRLETRLAGSTPHIALCHAWRGASSSSLSSQIWTATLGDVTLTPLLPRLRFPSTLFANQNRIAGSLKNNLRTQKTSARCARARRASASRARASTA